MSDEVTGNVKFKIMILDNRLVTKDGDSDSEERLTISISN